MILLSRVIDQHCSASALISINIDARNIVNPPVWVWYRWPALPSTGLWDRPSAWCAASGSHCCSRMNLHKVLTVVDFLRKSDEFCDTLVKFLIPPVRNSKKPTRVKELSFPCVTCLPPYNQELGHNHCQYLEKNHYWPGDMQSRNTSHLLTKPRMVGPKNMTSSSGWLVMINTLLAPCSSFTLW